MGQRRGRLEAAREALEGLASAQLDLDQERWEDEQYHAALNWEALRQDAARAP